MKVLRWLVVAGTSLLLTGCEPAEYRLELQSLRRVDETIVAIVPEANADLVEPILTSVLGDDWRVRKAKGSDGVHLTFRRHRQPAKDTGLEVTRTIVGPLRLRYEYQLRLSNPFARIGENAFLKSALENQEIALAVRVILPGGVLQEGDSQPGSIADDGAGVWAFQVKDVAARPDQTLVAMSRSWRFGLLILWGLAGLLLLYLVGPELLPTAEKRRAAAEKRAAKQAAKSEREAKRAAKKQARPKKEPKPRKRRGKQPEPESEAPPEPVVESPVVPAPAETDVAATTATAPEPVEPVTPAPAPELVAEPVIDSEAPASIPVPDQGLMLRWRRRRSLIRQRRKRRGWGQRKR